MRLALSVQQPWAWAIVHGYKDIENRDWPTRVRGLIFIHASKKVDVESLDWLKIEHPEIPWPTAFELGGIVGQARIVGCVRESTSPWFFGLYGFELRDGEPLPFRAWRGQLGFFRVPE